MKRDKEGDRTESDSSKRIKRTKVAEETSSLTSLIDPPTLDLNNLGAGYHPSDKRVTRAIEIYQKELLPFIKTRESVFKNSNFLTIKGYGTDIPIN